MKTRKLLVLALIVMLCGCEKQNAATSELIKKIEDLEKKTDTISTDVLVMKIDQERFSGASFDPADGKGYQRVDTTSGSFLISLREATPHLDGVKVTLEIGNIQAVSYSGFKLKLNYGKRYPKHNPSDTSAQRSENLDAYNKSKREKEEKFSMTLRPATWNTVTLILPDIKPADFGRMNLSMTTDSVLMKTN
jgi:hypothetical protein